MTTSPYISGDSMLHRLDPRVKVVLLLEICVILFWPTEVVWYAAAAGLMALLLLISGGRRGLASPLKAIFPLLVLVLVLTPLFHTGGELLFAAGPIRITSGGVHEALLLISRFTGLTLAFALFFVTTPMRTLILTLRWYRLPFRAALVITLSFRYIPTIGRLLQHVRDAHRLRDPMAMRGVRRGFASRLRDLQPVLTSVVIASIKLIPALAMSLEHRGISSPHQRSSYHRLAGRWELLKHVCWGLAAAAVLALPIWVRCI